MGEETDREVQPEGPQIGFRQFVWLWNHYQGQTTPPLHVEIAEWLERRWRQGDRRLVLLVFRSAGKSTLVGIFCAWLLLNDPDLRIMVLAAEHDLARKMVRNVKRIIERHPLTRGLRPKRAEQWASDQFTVRRRLTRRDPSLLARGIGANITGSRADVVICDDVEVPNTCATAPRREELRSRLQEISYVLVPDGLQLYVGTPHSYDSIYAEESSEEEEPPFLSGFQRLCLPLLDARGASRWPERFTPEGVAEIRRRSGPAKFESQMLLRPRSVEDIRLDPALLVRYDAPLELREANGESILSLSGRRLVSASCWWDPAYGAPDGGDASVVAAVFVDEAGGYWLHDIRYLTHDPARRHEVDEATQLCREVAAFVRELYLPSITIETNGLGRFLPALLRRELRTLGAACAVLEHVSRSSKEQRILQAFDPLLAAAALRAHAAVWASPFIEEMREWRPRRRCRDDGLDAVSGCLLAEPVRLPRAGPGKRFDWRPGRSLHRATIDFDP
ncbi:MAG TPA: phage terminase large subunit [Geminicoccaceae bacterium]|nr:phage terminase large subunit [Geminicoccaceae bacterium]